MHIVFLIVALIFFVIIGIADFRGWLKSRKTKAEIIKYREQREKRYAQYSSTTEPHHKTEEPQVSENLKNRKYVLKCSFEDFYELEKLIAENFKGPHSFAMQEIFLNDNTDEGADSEEYMAIMRSGVENQRALFINIIKHVGKEQYAQSLNKYTKQYGITCE
jgi:hypothetical protein